MKKPIWPANSLFFEHPDIYGISFDTRTIQSGDMFITLQAARDGHDYVKEAIEKGASCALVEREVCEKNIVVDSVIDTLIEIAKLRRKMFVNTVFIAITGSVGKTTSKRMIAWALENAGKKVFATEKSYNNLIGLSISLAQIPFDAEFAIMEVGTSGFGEIDQLARLVEPDYSFITEIGTAHIEKFSNQKNIALEKGALIAHTKKKAVFKQNSWYRGLFENIALDNNVECLEYIANKNDAYENMALGLDCLLNELGLPKVRWEFEIFNNIEGRRNIFQVHLNNAQFTIIDAAYNANLGSMIESIKFLKTFDGKKIAVLGDMVQIGDHAIRHHEILSCYLEDVEEVMCVGGYMKHLYNKLLKNGKKTYWFENLDSLKLAIIDMKENATILIKGSSDNHRSSLDLSNIVAVLKRYKAN